MNVSNGHGRWLRPAPSYRHRDLTDRLLARFQGDLFMGAPPWAALPAFIATAWSRVWFSTWSQRRWRGTWQLARTVFRYTVVEPVREFFKRQEQREPHPDRVAVLVHSVDPKIREFWEPVVASLGVERVVFIVPRAELRMGLPDGVPCYSLERSRANGARALFWLLSRLPRWWRAIRQELRAAGQSPGGEPRLIAQVFLVQITQMRADDLLRVVRPAALYGTNDLGVRNGGVFLAANALGIPTYSSVHGGVGSYEAVSFSYFTARRMFVWGALQRAYLTECGVPTERMSISGCQRTELATRRPEQIRAEIAAHGLDNKRPLIVIGCTVIPEHHIEVWLREVQRLHDLLPNYAFLFRPHPSQSASLFRPALREGPRMRIVDSQGLALWECLSVADAVVVHTSTIAFEALCMGKLMAVLDAYASAYLDLSYDIVEAGAAPYAQTAETLAPLLLRMLEDETWAAELRLRAAAFLSEYISESPIAPADYIAQTLAQHLSPVAGATAFDASGTSAVSDEVTP